MTVAGAASLAYDSVSRLRRRAYGVEHPHHPGVRVALVVDHADQRGGCAEQQSSQVDVPAALTTKSASVISFGSEVVGGTGRMICRRWWNL